MGHPKLSLSSEFGLNHSAFRLKELMRKMLRKVGEKSIGPHSRWLEFFADEQSEWG